MDKTPCWQEGNGEKRQKGIKNGDPAACSGLWRRSTRWRAEFNGRGGSRLRRATSEPSAPWLGVMTSVLRTRGDQHSYALEGAHGPTRARGKVRSPPSWRLRPSLRRHSIALTTASTSGAFWATSGLGAFVPHASSCRSRASRFASTGGIPTPVRRADDIGQPASACSACLACAVAQQP